MKHFIIVSGNIGVGKSTVANLIANIFGFKVMEEQVEQNPYLPLFYQDMKTYAYASQRFFLLARIVDHEIVSHSTTNCIQDRSVYEDAEIFAKNLYQKGILIEEDYERYKKIYDDIVPELERPTLLIYLRANTGTLRKRIAKRGRDYEKNLLDKDNEYLEQLNELYEEWIVSYEGEKLVIETDQLDVVANPDDLTLIVHKIKSSLGEKNIRLDQFMG